VENNNRFYSSNSNEKKSIQVMQATLGSAADPLSYLVMWISVYAPMLGLIIPHRFLRSRDPEQCRDG
jgi:hypothetical protein